MTSAVDFEVQLIQLLLANTGVANIVDRKVFPLIIPQGTKLPCVTVQRIAGMPANTLSGASGLEEIDLEIDAWGRTYSQVKDLAIAIRGAMPAQGPWGAHLIQDRDLFEEDSSYFRVMMRYKVWFLENTED